jgi:hypothetical protein
MGNVSVVALVDDVLYHIIETHEGVDDSPTFSMVPRTWLSTDASYVLYPEPGSKTSKNPSSWGNNVFKRNLYPISTGWMEYDVVRVLSTDPGM